MANFEGKGFAVAETALRDKVTQSQPDQDTMVLPMTKENKTVTFREE